MLLAIDCGSFCTLQLKQDDLWAKWMDVAFSKLDSNGDGYISLDEIVSTVPGSDDAGDVDNRLIAVSQASPGPAPQRTSHQP